MKLSEQARIELTCSNALLPKLAKLLRVFQNLGDLGGTATVACLADGDGEDKVGQVSINGSPLRDYLQKVDPNWRWDTNRFGVVEI